LRRHLLEQKPVSKLCGEFGLRPTVFYRWQKEFFENGRPAAGSPALRDDLRTMGFSSNSVTRVEPST